MHRQLILRSPNEHPQVAFNELHNSIASLLPDQCATLLLYLLLHGMPLHQLEFGPNRSHVSASRDRGDLSCLSQATKIFLSTRSRERTPTRSCCPCFAR